MKMKYLAVTLVLAVMFVLSFGSMTPVQASSRVADIVFKKSFIGQTADLTSAAVITAPAAGATYRVTAYGTIADLASCVTGFVDINVIDDFGVVASISRDHLIGIDGGTIDNRTITVHAAPGTPLTISTIHTQTGCPSAYNLYLVVEEL